MTTKYELTSLSAENCAVEIHSKMQELCFFQLKTHRLSTLLHHKTKKKHRKNKKKKTRQKKTIAKKLFFYISTQEITSLRTKKKSSIKCQAKSSQSENLWCWSLALNSFQVFFFV